MSDIIDRLKKYYKICMSVMSLPPDTRDTAFGFIDRFVELYLQFPNESNAEYELRMSKLDDELDKTLDDALDAMEASMEQSITNQAGSSRKRVRKQFKKSKTKFKTRRHQ
jgi:hypothetical protein